HTHSNASDGVLSPADLVREAGRRSIVVLGLTDHDTLAGLPEAIETASSGGIDLIPGVELSTEVDDHEVHILGYFVDPHDDLLAERLAWLVAKREERAERIVERLHELGFPIAYERVRTIAGPGTIGRPHIARAMIEAGYIETVNEGFSRFLATGRPVFVPKERVLPEDAVQLLVRAGAVPVLAHPLSTGDIEGTLKRLVPLGLRGLEVFYGEYGSAVHQDLLTIARRWRLASTGGSDYHGPGFKEGRELGSAPVPGWCVCELRSQMDRR
ncbi:MAG: PHP domain-containing protein, partial [Thermomicrobiales bacterium]|nr:PHP domain-containing protein [Thermomicrobiales bacterium]